MTSSPEKCMKMFQLRVTGGDQAETHVQKRVQEVHRRGKRRGYGGQLKAALWTSKPVQEAWESG